MTYGQMQKSAHRQVAKAIQENALVRPHRCEVCGLEDNCDHVEIVAHHWRGYDYPLDVWWICKSCNWQLRGRAFHKGEYSRALAALMIQGKSQYFGRCHQCEVEKEYSFYANKYRTYIQETKRCIQEINKDKAKYADLLNAMDIFLGTYDISLEDFMNCDNRAVVMSIRWGCDLHLREEFGLPSRNESDDDTR